MKNTHVNPENPVELIVRGVCALDGMLLLCRSRKAGNVYLPGGHLEPGEGLEQAIVREIREETGFAAVAPRFLGVAENRFVQKGVAMAEINFVFAIDIPGLAAAVPPSGLEGHIDFQDKIKFDAGSFQGIGLHDGARKAVKQEALCAIGLSDTFFD